MVGVAFVFWHDVAQPVRPSCAHAPQPDLIAECPKRARPPAGHDADIKKPIAGNGFAGVAHFATPLVAPALAHAVAPFVAVVVAVLGPLAVAPVVAMFSGIRVDTTKNGPQQ